MREAHQVRIVGSAIAVAAQVPLAEAGLLVIEFGVSVESHRQSELVEADPDGTPTSHRRADARSKAIATREDRCARRRADGGRPHVRESYPGVAQRLDVRHRRCVRSVADGRVDTEIVGDDQEDVGRRRRRSVAMPVARARECVVSRVLTTLRVGCRDRRTAEEEKAEDVDCVAQVDFTAIVRVGRVGAGWLRPAAEEEGQHSDAVADVDHTVVSGVTADELHGFRRLRKAAGHVEDGRN